MGLVERVHGIEEMEGRHYATLGKIVADGPVSFDGSDVGTLLGSALQTIDAIKTLPFSTM